MTATDDLAYLNPDPAAFARRWTHLPPSEADALEARLRASVRGGDSGFVSVPVPRIASTSSASASAALAAWRREAQAVDARLQRKVSLAVKGVAFSDLCAELEQKTGIAFSAARSVQDDKVTIFCRDRPVRDILRQISALFNFSWERTGADQNEWRYRLTQSLRAQLLEEELRNRDRDAALLALDRDMEAFRKHLHLTPDEARALAQDAQGEDKKRLEALAGPAWGAAQLYFGLSPDEAAALRGGQGLRWGNADASGNGVQRPLPANLAQNILQSQAGNTRIETRPDGEISLRVENDPAKLQTLPGVPPAQIADAQAVAQLEVKRDELGQFSLLGMAGIAIDRENSKVSSLSGRNLATGVSPSVQNPQNAEANAKHKTDPILTPLVTIRPRPSCPAAEDDRRDEARAAASPAPPAATPPQQAARRHHTQVTSADVLEAIHKASGQDVIGDHFSRLHDPASGSAEKVRLFDALNTICDVLRLRWSRQETPGRNDDPAAAWLTFRSTSFFNDRLKEVPNRLLAGWRTARREHGSLPLADLLAIAGLHDAQLDSRTMAASVQTCYDLPEWSLAAVNNLRPHWRFLAGLPRPLREACLERKRAEFPPTAPCPAAAVRHPHARPEPRRVTLGRLRQRHASGPVSAAGAFRSRPAMRKRKSRRPPLPTIGAAPARRAVTKSSSPTAPRSAARPARRKRRGTPSTTAADVAGPFLACSGAGTGQKRAIRYVPSPPVTRPACVTSRTNAWMPRITSVLSVRRPIVASNSRPMTCRRWCSVRTSASRPSRSIRNSSRHCSNCSARLCSACSCPSTCARSVNISSRG
jgi:hypothetical protein